MKDECELDAADVLMEAYEAVDRGDYRGAAKLYRKVGAISTAKYYEQLANRLDAAMVRMANAQMEGED